LPRLKRSCLRPLFGSTDPHGTRWRIGAWPIGGKCDYANDNITGEVAGTFEAASFRSKAVIYFAGSIANFALAVVLALAGGWPFAPSSLIISVGSTPEATLVFLAALSAFLGFFNLLPLLPLDGGHFALSAVEQVRGKSITATLRTRFAAVGMVIISLATLLLICQLLRVL
jgi:membrane-associated protease RseP (regulator of RpoE activity)